MLNKSNNRVIGAVVVLLVISDFVFGASNLQEKFKWKQVDFAWKSTEHKEQALRNRDFIPENNLPLGIERWQDKLFVTVPRWKPGVASSLNYVDLNEANESPLLKPYPSWENHQLCKFVTLNIPTPTHCYHRIFYIVCLGRLLTLSNV